MNAATMTSQQLNEAIWALDDELSGKPIPYHGWAWREVDFDASGYRFGVMPGNAPTFSMSNGIGTVHGPPVGAKYVGFMENNKWGYPYTRETTPEEWSRIKHLIEIACRERTDAAVNAVREAIDAVSEGFEPEWEPW